MTSTRGTWRGFWRDTGRAISEDYRRKLQRQARQMPLLFGLAWGTKGLAWNLTAKTIAYKGAVRPAYRKVQNVRAVRRGDEAPYASLWRTNPKQRAAATVAPGGVTGASTVSTATPAPPSPISASPVASPFAALAAGTKTTNAQVIPLPIQTGDAMQRGSALLKRSSLGRQFLALAAEYDEFVPPRGDEAASVADLMNDSSQAWGLIADGVDAWADTIAACGIDRRVVVALFEAADDLATASGRWRKAARVVDRLYEGQLEQDESGAMTVQTLPIRVAGGGVAAEGIRPLSVAIAAEYMSATPAVDEEATSILEGLRTSQAALATCAEAVDQLAHRLRGQHRVDRQVTGLVSAAADSLDEAASSCQRSRTVLRRLYQGQLEQEGSNVASIRTIPLSA